MLASVFLKAKDVLQNGSLAIENNYTVADKT